jgi:hypothetical protein
MEKKIDYTIYFTEGTRIDGTKFVKLVDNAPIKLQELIKEIHINKFRDCMPNDWIYGTILEAFSDLKNDSLEDITIEADSYNADLLEWLGNSYSEELCNEAIEEEIWDRKNIYNLISSGQSIAKELIYNSVNEFMQEDEE